MEPTQITTNGIGSQSQASDRPGMLTRNVAIAAVAPVSNAAILPRSNIGLESSSRRSGRNPITAVIPAISSAAAASQTTARRDGDAIGVTGWRSVARASINAALFGMVTSLRLQDHQFQ